MGQDFILDRGNRRFSNLQCWFQTLGPHTDSYPVGTGNFSRRKSDISVKLSTYFHLDPWLKWRKYTSAPHMCLWRSVSLSKHWNNFASLLCFCPLSGSSWALHVSVCLLKPLRKHLRTIPSHRIGLQSFASYRKLLLSFVTSRTLRWSGHCVDDGWLPW
jgi:hypothetical protein